MALIKILLVDDDEMVRVTLCEVLKQNGFAVTSAANVTEALKHISSGTFWLRRGAGEERPRRPPFRGRVLVSTL